MGKWCRDRQFQLPWALLGALLLLAGCGRPETVAAAERLGPQTFRPHLLGQPGVGAPWITHLAIVDLDQDGLLDVLACEGRLNQLLWLRQLPSGDFHEQVLADNLPGAAHVQAVDLDGDSDLDLLVACLGIVMPNNEKIGSVVVLENLGQLQFRPRVLLENVSRVSYVTAGDLDGDGDLDLVVGHFGYFEGEIRWMENQGDWAFESHLLLDLPGAVHAPVVDIDGDGDLDIVALVTQNSEEIYLFENDGHGVFTARVIWGSTNPDFGSSGIAVADIDGDGDLDIACTNGDGFDYATAGARPWHGVQWLENVGRGEFRYHRLGDFAGSYSPVIVDLDGDGDQDIVVVSGFNDWRNHSAPVLACFENLGQGRFVRRVLGYAPTHLIVAAAADLNGDGRIEIVTGGLAFHGATDRAQRLTRWQRREQGRR
jgi:hypothetical protein